MARGFITVDFERCKGCQLCLTACPQHVLEMDPDRLNSMGYHPARLQDPEVRCTGCGLCAVICPDVAITVFRHVASRPLIVAAGG